MMGFLRVFCAFLLFGLGVSTKNTGCPTLSVSPCTCTNSPFPFLVCDNVLNTDELRNVFINSAGTKYNVVRLTNPVLQYVPYDIFEGVEVQELQLINGTLISLFDRVPENIPSLRTLHIENTNIFSSISWEHLQTMTNLRILNIYSSKITVLGEEFVQYAPKSLEQISFYDTKIVDIKAGVFGHFPNLDKVAVDHSQLSELNRNIFPVPFNGRVLYFNENHLASLPGDMFSNMPNLQTLGLRGNSLTTVPRHPYKNLQYFDLRENPLNCDCNLAWITKLKNLVLKGTCFSPEALRGRDLKDVYNNMQCL